MPATGPARPVAPPFTPTRPSRADARRNYDRLVAAADELFDEQGTDVPLDDVVRRAGLGSGTLYRHFPNRDALMAAVFWERIEVLCQEAESLLAEPESTQAFTAWLRKLIRLTMRRGLAAALAAGQRSTVSEVFLNQCHLALEGASTPLLARAQADGGIRPDLRADDLLTFAHTIASAAQRAPDGEQHADQLLELLLEGLRTRNEPSPS
ncbi:TetR family transcriptional regulator [Streptomyces sp. 3MP-14]|uniref:TetR family transcriptional regulator n=1 Tax=Streptomyces mimosae TaxID=2586635 RepID=A0A5N6AGY7_9ACTN|nr:MULTISPECIES: TetR/AcrR family transcriptional regulator [Streptomyces]KAB8167944.1 TetR family transcriptional regulator [Streptomyces mimosae]KAB8177408.1 TetR family transcriptional regulator [Streptomyces sp. 3MP-14]